MVLVKSQISGLTVNKEVYEYGVEFSVPAGELKALLDAGHVVKVEKEKEVKKAEPVISEGV